MRSIVLALSSALVLLASCSSSSDMPAQPTTDTQGIKMLTGMHTVVLKTSMGDITLELDADAAPKTVTNFITHAKNGYYDGLIFHRIIKDFMIQSGDPDGNGTGGESIYGETFEDEINAESYGLHKAKLTDVASPADLERMPEKSRAWSIKDYYEAQGYRYKDIYDSMPMKKGAIAMANRGPNTNGSQFFIIHAEATPWLEGKHTVFGTVVEGMDVVDAIANVQVGSGDKPVKDVTMTVKVR